MIPGFDSIILLESLMIKSKVERAIVDGFEQFVLLSDSHEIWHLFLAAAHPGVVCFELSDGERRQNKIDGLKAFNKYSIETLEDAVTVNQNTYFVKHKLSEDNLKESLEKNGFDKNKKTLFLAPDIMLFLSKNDNKKLLESLLTVVKADDEILLSFSVNGADDLFSLSTNEVIPFAQEVGFAVTGKFFPPNHLKEIEDHNAATYYLENQHAPMDYFYVLQKASNPTLINIISDIPELPFHVPSLIAEEEDGNEIPVSSIYNYF